MKNIKRYGLLLLIGSLLLCGTACGTVEKKTPIEKSVEEEELNIGITFDTFVIERWQRDRDVFVSEANDLGASVNVQNANGDAEEQVNQVSYFIDEKMDVIVIIAIDAEKLLPVIEKAKEKGIKIIAYDRKIPGANVDLYISFDNEKIGELMANAIASQLSPDENVLMICGAPTDPNVQEVQMGFVKAMKSTGINILDITYAENWRGEYGQEYINNNLEKVDMVSAIMCGNDEIAGYAIRGLVENSVKKDIIVVGQDADVEACQRIVDGEQYMTVFKEIDQLASKAAKAAVSLAQGKLPEEPMIILNPIAVTKENMDQQIIEKGYHSKEDIYLSIVD